MSNGSIKNELEELLLKHLDLHERLRKLSRDIYLYDPYIPERDLETGQILGESGHPK